MLERVESLISRAISSVALNAIYRIGIVFCILQYKAYAKAVNYKVESSGDSPESVTSQISPVELRLKEWRSGTTIDFGS